MLTPSGHLTYCTNIHAGESWPEHFAAIKNNFPSIKNKLSPAQPMGIGLRLSNVASIDLVQKEILSDFKDWLQKENAYVFTMNGFPYGGFHHTKVKDQVHAPDWTTNERVNYTLRLFEILTLLIPDGMEGGISTSPLSYKHWFKQGNEFNTVRNACTENIIRVIEQLVVISKTKGIVLHLDIEPEPDGMLETGSEFLNWFQNELLPLGIPLIAKKFNLTFKQAEDLIKEHLRLCYDVCHFAIGFENHAKVIEKILSVGIKIGKIQISAALKARMDLKDADAYKVRENFAKFNEPVYLHQVIAKLKDGKLIRYPDLSKALEDNKRTDFLEWRAHFHVPVFAKDFGLLSSTHDEIIKVLALQKLKPFTKHLEVETYTWEILPPGLKLPIKESIVRELDWVRQQLDS